MPANPTCQRCGAVLPADVPQGLCPRCLLAAALETPPPEGASPEASDTGAAEEASPQIGRYKILQRLGEGGCGMVYMAEQTEPVRRQVALKVIKLGMDTRQVIARFEAERQALALMDHPNIAKVLDAGATETGRPYFVMELVKGIRITDFCDQHQLSTAERLGLFTQVCQAIQHAHQKGIIHRDIKPSNILVTLHDGVPVPKVIDFGIAKATEQALTEKTVFTAFGQFMGTPAYMSPEQAELSGLDLDTRSDIYALGVLLYELLTGRTPFDAKELLQAGLDEMRRRIREEEPVRPSTRLSTMANADLTLVAQQRRSESAKLKRFIRGDLDWIVMKCLEKDRNRRYETANGLAMDIRRHLGDEPVLAGPPSATYRVRKLVRRNKLMVGATCAVVAAILAGLGLSTWRLIRERAASARAVKAEREAITKADDAKAVLRFLQDKVLAAARPEGQQGGLGREVTLRRAVEAAEPQIAVLFTNRPLVEAEVRNALGSTFFYLGDYPKAIQQAERSVELGKANLDKESPERLVYLSNLALNYRGAGRIKEAVTLYEQILEIRKSRLGPGHRDTLAATIYLGNAYLEADRFAEALPLLEEALKLCQARLGSDDPLTFNSQQDLARLYRRIGRIEEALPLFEDALKKAILRFGRDNPTTLSYLNDVAASYWAANRLPEAIPMLEEILAIAKAKLGPENDKTLGAMGNLASAYKDSGQLAKAIPLYEDALKGSTNKLGTDHPYTMMFMNNLAIAYFKDNRLKEALPIWEEAFRLQRAKLGTNHSETLNTMNNLAMAYRHADRLAESLAMAEEALRLSRAKLGPDHPTALACLSNLASARKDSAQWPEALALYEDLLRRSTAKLGPDHPQTLDAMHDLGLTYDGAGRTSEALPLLEQNLELSRKNRGPAHPDTLYSMGTLATVYLEASRLPEARILLEPLLAAQRAQNTAEHPQIAETQALLGECLLRQGNSTNAATMLRDSLGDLERQQPASPTTFKTQILLGWALLAQRDFAGAEPMLTNGYGNLVQVEAAGHSPRRKRFLEETGAKIVRLYEEWAAAEPDPAKTAKATEWKQKLKELDKPAAGAEPDVGK